MSEDIGQEPLADGERIGRVRDAILGLIRTERHFVDGDNKIIELGGTRFLVHCDQGDELMIDEYEYNRHIEREVIGNTKLVIGGEDDYYRAGDRQYQGVPVRVIETFERGLGLVTVLGD